MVPSRFRSFGFAIVCFLIVAFLVAYGRYPLVGLNFNQKNINRLLVFLSEKLNLLPKIALLEIHKRKQREIP
jgi:hypothetical protein